MRPSTIPVRPRPRGRPGGSGQTLADGDQTLADLDQTTSDSDQTSADDDEAAAVSDQAAADDDQAASDRDFAAGGNPEVHGSSRQIREQSAKQRRDANRVRAESALNRDSVATARDLAAVARDKAAGMLDRELDEHDAAWVESDPHHNESKPETRASEKRAGRPPIGGWRPRRGPARLSDRKLAAADRAAAAIDRKDAQEDREALLRQVAFSELDALTGARTRGPGLADLDNEIDRARRTADGQLAVAYVDVVGLKKVNDERVTWPATTSCATLVRVIRDHLRSYDSVVRIGGDEFLCVISGAAVPVVRNRLDSVKVTLAAERPGGEIRFGIAVLASDDTATKLIARADTEMRIGQG